MAIPEYAIKGFWCCFYGMGIIGMLVIYGLLQERIMSQPYGKEYFTVSVFLVLCNRLVAILFSISMIIAKGEQFLNQAPLWKYFAISLSSVSATTCQYEALKYVSFPVQMLGKSFKMMPVMCWGMAISGKRYSLVDWMVALAVTWGVTQFLMTGSISAAHNASNSVYGLLLLVAFLGFDGFTSTFQEKLFKEHETSKYNQMLYINFGSACVSLVSCLLIGGFAKAIGFIVRHPVFMRDTIYLSAAAVGGQWFIYSQVKEFGALVFAATMNVRQVVSILLSYITYGHSITLLQVGGLLFVFTALFYKSFAGLSDTKSKSESEKTPLLPGNNGTPSDNAQKQQKEEP